MSSSCGGVTALSLFGLARFVEGAVVVVGLKNVSSVRLDIAWAWECNGYWKLYL